MAINTRPSASATSPAITPVAKPAEPRRNWRLRGTLAALSAFLALTATQGAIFVVPAMPRSVLHKGVLALFPDFTIPALALGILCGGSALVALVAVLVRPQLGALASIVAGLLMIVFELVEIVVVGFTPVQTPDQFPAWLQVIYLVVGGAMVILGARLWKAKAGSYSLRLPG